MSDSAQPRKAYLAYLVGLGFVGAVALAVATLRHPISQSFSVMLAFLGLGIMARIMAFPLYRGRVIAFDVAYYIAAGIVLGWVEGAWIVVATMAVDELVQTYRRRVFELPRPTRAERIASAIFQTFGTGLLILTVGAIVDLLGLSPEHGTRADAVFVVTPVALLSAVIIHYHAAYLGMWLNGHRGRRAYRRLTINGMVGEALLTPLAMVMVLVYQAADLAPFTLLALTLLTINAGFFIAARYGQRLARRVRDLSVINAVSRMLVRDLELEPVLGTIARQLLKHFPATSAVVVGLRVSDTGKVTCALFDADGQQVLDKTLEFNERLLGRVLLERHSLRDGDLATLTEGRDQQLVPEDMRSFVAVPMQVHDMVIGVIALMSRRPRAFRRNDEQLLVQVAAPAAIAVENARLFRLATVDALTGLFVRRYFDQRLAEECQRAERFGNVFSVLMLDLDDFKLINDTRGHAAGDRVLRETAHIVRNALRAVDIAARYGGEEFVVLLPRADTEEARTVAERICRAVSRNAIAGVTGQLQVTVSIGVAAYPDHALDPVELVRFADKALYRAKRAGKNRVVTAPTVAPDST